MRKFGCSMTGLIGGAILSAGTVLAGDLDSTGAPESVNHYTLEHLYNRLNAGTAGAMQPFTEPVAGPGTATMHTLNQIMEKAPALDEVNGASPANVANGKTFWGLTAGQWGLKTGTAVPAPVAKTGASKDSGDAYEEVAGEDRLVNAGRDWPIPRFTDNANGTVTDNLTGLIWLKNANVPDATRNWANALADVAELNADGTMNGKASGDTSNGGSHQIDWRLPNIKELQSLVDFAYINPSLCNATGTAKWEEGDPSFTNVKLSQYWSSTTAIATDGTGTFAWYIFMSHGKVDKISKGGGAVYYVWPVRGPQ